MTSSVNDLNRWMRLQLGGGRLDGARIVDESALDRAHVPTILRTPLSAPDAAGQFAGLGWEVDVDGFGFTRWGHSGAFTAGAATTAVLLPAASLGIVVLTNGLPMGVPQVIANEFLDTVVVGAPTKDWSTIAHQAFAPLLHENPDLAQLPAPATAAKPLSAYVGTYQSDYWGTFQVRLGAGGGLELVEGPAQVVFPLTHWDGDTFTYVPDPELPPSAPG